MGDREKKYYDWKPRDVAAKIARVITSITIHTLHYTPTTTPTPIKRVSSSSSSSSVVSCLVRDRGAAAAWWSA